MQLRNEFLNSLKRRAIWGCRKKRGPDGLVSVVTVVITVGVRVVRARVVVRVGIRVRGK